jgi:hypothetical protein
VSLKPLLSFSSGELDPILHDHVTLEKFKKGLHTARNVMVSKTGGLLSRFSRSYFVDGKNANEQIKLFSPPNSSALLVWGNLYVRTYDFTGALVNEVAHLYNEAQVQTMHFTASGKYVYAFVEGQTALKFLYDDATPAFVASADVFALPLAPTNMAITANGAPTGYSVDYLVSKVKNGEESLGVEITGTTYKKPLAAGESNTITVDIELAFAGDLDEYSGIRVYRRPNSGGAYGFIGSSSNMSSVGATLSAAFEDLGGSADFTNGFQETITKTGLSGIGALALVPKTGTVYQQRLLMANIVDDEEAILASRSGFQNNFYRDFPYDSDSALKFKSGTSGKASVLRMVDNDGLIVFTNVGVFVSVGALTIDNIALEKKGSWVIDENIPPLSVPGGVFFVDAATNTVRQLIFSQDILTYQTLDQSIFSDHLFRSRTITSWAYQTGAVPMIIVTFSDGTWATFTYHFEHQMRAWTRHDSEYPVEAVIETGVADSTFFVTNKNGVRQVEVSIPRYTPAATVVANPEYDKFSTHAFMDAIKTYSIPLHESLAGSDVFTLTPVIADTWDGELTLTCGTSAIFITGGPPLDEEAGDIGRVFRVFALDGSSVDLTVTARASDDEVTVVPSIEYPLADASGFRMYQCFYKVTGLDHLEDEQVSVMSDGYVVKSPYNDIENYGTTTVLLGQMILPAPTEAKAGEVGNHAIVVVGRPITADIKTLNISTVEQKPTMIESINCTKLYIRVHESRGLYVSNEFPEEAENEVDGNGVLGMQNFDVYKIPRGNDILGNRFLAAQSERVELPLKGSWESQGKVSIRQVDPVHFQILSIIPDVEVLNRSNR